ncbi:MAG: endonuclease/exonuclease/phosphatase family protein [Planctomycetaceae bacterium]|nr:endonuclease/exonuclease/phosphatase family protein [Planctomycetaceae bacterium]MBV8554934.1 endonuclease/exonuclease/phosphatase family protein [Planctomycetaceae bacterium]
MRLLSYNIHKGIGGRDRLYRIERIIRVIEEENPDLMCLQEVDRDVRRSRHDDQPTRLAEAFYAEEHFYQLNVHVGSGGYGNLILSRWPLRLTHQVSLRLRRLKPRGAQLAVVETPEGPLHLVNWHLGLAEHERHWQARHLLEHACFHELAHWPTLVVGDSNDWRNTLAHGVFAHHGFEQVTAPRERFRTFPAYFAVASLDKAFARGGIAVRHARVVLNPLTRRASDHLPLVVDFHLESARRSRRHEGV